MPHNPEPIPDLSKLDLDAPFMEDAQNMCLGIDAIGRMPPEQRPDAYSKLFTPERLQHVAPFCDARTIGWIAGQLGMLPELRNELDRFFTSHVIEKLEASGDAQAIGHALHGAHVMSDDAQREAVQRKLLATGVLEAVTRNGDIHGIPLIAYAATKAPDAQRHEVQRLLLTPELLSAIAQSDRGMDIAMTADAIDRLPVADRAAALNHLLTRDALDKVRASGGTQGIEATKRAAQHLLPERRVGVIASLSPETQAVSGVSWREIASRATAAPGTSLPGGLRGPRL
jgi:hypothetical protein